MFQNLLLKTSFLSSQMMLFIKLSKYAVVCPCNNILNFCISASRIFPKSQFQRAASQIPWVPIYITWEFRNHFKPRLFSNRYTINMDCKINCVPFTHIYLGREGGKAGGGWFNPSYCKFGTPHLIAIWKFWIKNFLT